MAPKRPGALAPRSCSCLLRQSLLGLFPSDVSKFIKPEPATSSFGSRSKEQFGSPTRSIRWGSFPPSATTRPPWSD